MCGQKGGRHCWPVAIELCVILSITTGLLSGCTKEEPAKISPQKATPTSKTTEVPDQRAATSYAALSAQQQSRAKQIFAQHCSACHGEKGDGNGLAARYLFPKPRNFRAGKMRLVTTTDGIPTIADIETVLKRGMPGSAMPPWPQLNDDDKKLLAEQVIEFRRQGIRDLEIALAKEDDEEVDEKQIQAIVLNLTTPGALVHVPPIREPSAETVQHGKELYEIKGCVKCHGKDGRGDGTANQVDEEGFPTRPRDLTKGIFKGSPDPKSVYIRTQAGMPGTPMPSTPSLTHEEITDLVHFVLSLSDEKSRAANVLNREQIVAVIVQTAPVSPDDAIWNEVAPVHVRLTPLWWRDDFQPNLEVQAVHDGKSISLRLSWADANADTHAAKSESFEDAVAVELYQGDAEPFLGMGAQKSSVDIWMWDADRQSGGPDVDAVNPNLVVDRYPFSEKVVGTAEYKRPGTETAAQPDISLPARASGNQIVPIPSSRVPAATSLETSGPGTVTFRPSISQFVNAEGLWKDGRWNIVMTRALIVEDAKSGVSLKPGERVSLAFAVWDGSQRDRDGKKLISIWQDLQLEKD